MCGPTSSEYSLERQAQNFSSVLQNNYNTLFGQQQGVLSAINRSLSPTLAAGPDQKGFSADELAARNTQAINAAGAANTAAQQAARTYGAGQGGGGTSGVTSGITKQIQSSIGTQVANNLGNAQGQIVNEDYAVGRDNYNRAVGGAMQLAGEYSPNAAQSGTISSNQSAFGEASQIQQQQQQEDQAIAGGITSLAENVALPGISSMQKGEGFFNFGQ
jgi:hypothetical protein